MVFPGASMVFSWGLHGAFIDFRKDSMVLPWCFQGGVCAFMGISWYFRGDGVYAFLSWFFHGAFTVISWCFHGFHDYFTV